MKSLLHVGNDIDATKVMPDIQKAIVAVLETIAVNRIDRETGLKALEIIGMNVGNHNITVSHCNLINKPNEDDNE